MKTIRILILTILFMVFAYGIYFHINYEKELIRIELGEYSGRIYSNQEVNYQEPVTINVSLEEARRFGEQAILTYDNNTIEIWQPDSQTIRGFLHYKAEFRDGFWSTRIEYKEKAIVIYRITGFIYFSLLVVFFLFLLFWSAFEYPFREAKS